MHFSGAPFILITIQVFLSTKSLFQETFPQRKEVMAHQLQLQVLTKMMLQVSLRTRYLPKKLQIPFL